MVEKLQWQTFSQYFEPRPRDWHKGQSGHVLIIGGGPGMAGAVRLAAVAAFKVGAGLVSVATHPEHAAFINIAQPEIMSHAVKTPAELDPLLARSTVMVIGPGLGQSEWSKELMHYAYQQKLPMVVDADGLNLLATAKNRNDNWILTPHAGEAARLLGISVEDVQHNREAAVAAITKRYGGVCVLKGVGTLIRDAESDAMICDKGNPGMATAGMGDVLSGVIAGLVGQGLDLRMAAEAGVLIHALAGDRSAKESGERGMMASDIFPYLRQIVNLG